MSVSERVMKEYRYSGNYDFPLLAELYDRTERFTDDIELLRRLIGNSGPLNILECFSGTGRVLIPLALDGHRVTGIEMAPAMNARAAAKLAELSATVQRRVTLKVQDALDRQWGTGYDLVIMADNAFYELPTAETQERCIQLAHEALAPGGRLFIDNNDYKGDWPRGPFGRRRVIFEGHGADGVFGRYSVVGLRFDEPQGILHMRRTWFTRAPDGTRRCVRYLGRKHPVRAAEVERWLKKRRFRILQTLGDSHGNPYAKESDRAVFWARR
ncbi:MAG: class I SAM-dependent methyltransferase [Planctomycetes bacterium]|nr:class I SAM-dependent methyltransferase [Planctomycetota bacterium]